MWRGNEAILKDYCGGNIVERRGACGNAQRRRARTVTNYRYANGAKREDEGKDGNFPGEIDARTHRPRPEINLNELICHLSLRRGTTRREGLASWRDILNRKKSAIFPISSTFTASLCHFSPTFDLTVQTCAEKRDCFAKQQPGMAGCGWLPPGRNFLST